MLIDFEHRLRWDIHERWAHSTSPNTHAVRVVHGRHSEFPSVLLMFWIKICIGQVCKTHKCLREYELRYYCSQKQLWWTETHEYSKTFRNTRVQLCSRTAQWQLCNNVEGHRAQIKWSEVKTNITTVVSWMRIINILKWPAAVIVVQLWVCNCAESPLGLWSLLCGIYQWQLFTYV